GGQFGVGLLLLGGDFALAAARAVEAFAGGVFLMLQFGGFLRERFDGRGKRAARGIFFGERNFNHRAAFDKRIGAMAFAVGVVAAVCELRGERLAFAFQ